MNQTFIWSLDSITYMTIIDEYISNSDGRRRRGDCPRIGHGSDVNHGRLYPNLNALIEMGLVEKSALDRRTNESALTEAGHDVIVNRLSWVFSRFLTSQSRAAEINDLVKAA